MVTRTKAQKPEIPKTHLGKNHEADYDMDSPSKNITSIPVPKTSRHIPKVGAV